MQRCLNKSVPSNCLLKQLLLGTAILANTSVLYAQNTALLNAAWLPVTKEERSVTTPSVQKDASAEILFWRVHVTDNFINPDWQRILHHYVRLKVFSTQGVEKATTVEIPYGEKTAILGVAGRTIKADESVTELKKDSIHDREVIRVGHIRRHVKSFAMPGVEPGAIIEYRWREVRHRPELRYMRLQFQREYPARKVTYFIKPLSRDYISLQMYVWPFNCQPSPLKVENDGYNSTSVENVPAFREEPMMPAEWNVRPWALVFYDDGKKREADKYWAEVGKKAYQDLKSSLKVNDDLKQAAAAVVENSNAEEKVQKLIRYIRTNFRNVFDSEVTEAERAAVIKRLSKDRLPTAVEIFKSRLGTPDELNTLFAALALDVGLDARPAFVASRDDILFDPSMTERHFLRSIDMAVKIGDKWRLYDVSARHLPSHLLSWKEEGVHALLSDPKKPEFISSPLSNPEASLTRRDGKFKLYEDGTLEGDVDESYTGHSAGDQREGFAGHTGAKQQEELKEQLIKVFPQALVSDISIGNVEDAEQPVRIRYHIRVPGYAQRTGKRLFFQPTYFQRGSAPLFSASERQHDIHFRYSWMEIDKIHISLPAVFKLDNAENPGGVDFGEPGSYALEMGVTQDNQFVCGRRLVWGNKGIILFPKAGYPQLKRIFDEVHQRDTHTISLRLVETGVGSK